VTVHGGDVWQVADQLGIRASELLDFSANINPRGLPLEAQARLTRDAADARSLSFYPDPSAMRLREALSKQLGVSSDAIVVGPGAEALLAPILGYLRPESALVPAPAFSEYRRVCEQLRIEFRPFALHGTEQFRTSVDRLCERIASESPGVVLLNNPHNPSGAMLQPDQIRRVFDAARSSGSTLVLDEAFIDYAPRASLVRDAVTHPGLIVIRSLTKFYGCPALREYAEASLSDNAAERTRMAGLLSSLGFTVFPSAANYLLLELRPDMAAASELRSRLIARHRILIRTCDSYEGLTLGRFVRVAIRSSADNERLIQALTRELGKP
jgi:threonine-phosphate decarboxylase